MKSGQDAKTKAMARKMDATRRRETKQFDD
jgi:hypothetical protein